MDDTPVLDLVDPTDRLTRRSPQRGPPAEPIAAAEAVSHERRPARAMSLPETDVARVRRWVAELDGHPACIFWG